MHAASQEALESEKNTCHTKKLLLDVRMLSFEHEDAGDDFELYTNPPVFVTRTTFRWQTGDEDFSQSQRIYF